MAEMPREIRVNVSASPEIRELLADAWDMGYRVGNADVYFDPSDNPFRAEH